MCACTKYRESSLEKIKKPSTYLISIALLLLIITIIVTV